MAALSSEDQRRKAVQACPGRSLDLLGRIGPITLPSECKR
jgi:hypothetical protein